MSHARKRSAWAENTRIRSTGSKNLTTAAAATGVSRFIQELITLSYADGADRWLDETARTEPTWITESAHTAELHALALNDSGVAGIVLRFAALYAADAEHSQYSIRATRRGYSPLIGRYEDYNSMLHADDAAGAVLAALALEPGVYNVAEDEPLTRRELEDVIAESAGRDRLPRIPDWLARAVGGDAARLVMRSQRISNRALRSASNWAPEHSSARHGWPRIVDELRASASSPTARAI